MAKIVIARAERGISCFLYSVFTCRPQSQQSCHFKEGRGIEYPTTGSASISCVDLTPLTPSPLWGSFCGFSCPEGKSQGYKTSQLVLLATQMLPHLCSRGKLFPNRPCLAKSYCSNQLESACKQHTHPKAAGQFV